MRYLLAKFSKRVVDYKYTSTQFSSPRKDKLSSQFMLSKDSGFIPNLSRQQRPYLEPSQRPVYVSERDESIPVGRA